MAISEERARVIALEYARQHLDIDAEIAVVEGHVTDLGNAWRIPYNSRIFLETKAVSHALVGNRPVLVDKRSGEPTFEGSD